jgi:hypothetical protein
MRYHLVHLHRLRRSRRDAEVYYRNEKRFKFALMELPVTRTLPFDMLAWQAA